MFERILNEPVLIAALVRQSITLAAAFGLSLTTEQTAALVGLVELVTTLVTRAMVTPTRRVEP